MNEQRPSKERFALWRQRVETYGGFQLTKPESLELFAEIGRLQSDNATLLESRREIACDLARTESARSALLAENTHYKDACAEFVKMQHDIASLLEVDAETDSIDLHQRIYGELQRRASSEPLAALDARLDGVKREMATNLYSRAAAVLRAYAQDAGDDHSVGICNCSDIALVDELDTAARASQPPKGPHVHSMLLDQLGWICSVCYGWNHPQYDQCTHTHAVTKSAGPRGKPCTCDTSCGGSIPCYVESGGKLGELWYCQKQAATEKADECMAKVRQHVAPVGACITGYWQCPNCKYCNSETIHHTSCPNCTTLRPAHETSEGDS